MSDYNEALRIPPHPGPWTLDEVLALPEDNGHRVELLDGVLIVSPAPDFAHQRLLGQLIVQLSPSIPAGCELLPGINVVLNPGRLVIPDLAVTTTPGANKVYGTADEMLLAVEIVSASSEVADKILKRHVYAEAGVPYYLVCDPSGAILLERIGTEYQETEHWPFPVTLDVSGMQVG